MKGNYFMNNYFYCYNNQLKNWLVKKGRRYITEGVNKNSGSTFFLFEKSPELDEYINQYRIIQNKKRNKYKNKKSKT